MSLRLAFDLDGVLADMESALIHEAKKLFGEAVAPAPIARARRPTRRLRDSSDTEASHGVSNHVPPAPTLRLTTRQERQLWRHVGSIRGFWESLKEVETGSVGRLAALARERRWEVIFLTRRPESAGFTAQVQTQHWLEAHGYPLPSVFVVHGSRGRIAAALGLDVVVDDRPENCVDIVVGSHSRAILLWRADPRTVPIIARRPGIQVAESFDECLTRLSKLAPSVRARSDLVGRMMRQLGIKDLFRG